MLIDETSREQATDPTLSCILQAPAGSGKTEVLTQRFLRLLARAHKPEEIIALTFTKKAANEMRERVLLALERANSNTLVTGHQQKTQQYAKEALAQDKRHEWQLLKLPHRLRITTIDSLCQTLAHALPLQEHNIPYAHITETPHTHYQKAAHACFEHALNDPMYQNALTVLLTHFDNRQDKVLHILSSQLNTREQWLHKLFIARHQEKQQFEKALALIETHDIERFKASIPKPLQASLMSLAVKVATIENLPQSPRFILTQWQDWDQLNPQIIQALASLLLTTQLTWRKGFDHHVGFKRDKCDKGTYDTLKEAGKALLEQLHETPKCLEALIRVRQLPAPIYPESAWHILQALFSLLPLLSAYLELIFREENTTDFIAIAKAAHHALTVDDAPTDLALYLDSAIHHLLIDEFQDTSIQQFELVSQLVEGFEPNDGKTVFIVGDPMQSIYRFRNAEVGLFLRAIQHGIGPVKLKFLQLQCNFRSNSILVDWFNLRFETIFPIENDLESGAIQFQPATAIHKTDQNSFIRSQQYASKEDEAKAILSIIEHELIHHPDSDIAILVRTRRQLSSIIQALRSANIPYQGIDIDWLAELPHIQDAWSLTQCLLMPGHRLAWVSVLRSPWCGLSLSDLLILANINKKRSIYGALAEESTYQQLSEEGQIRARFFYQAIHHAITHRQQQPIAQWILNTFQLLHLDAVLSTQEQKDLHEYLNLLEKYEENGLLSDTEAFKKALNELYSKQPEPSKLQIMTIHKAKGLEFDCVILPALSAKTTQVDQPLLRWLTLPTIDHDPLILVSPLKATHQDQCPLYEYLSQLDKEKERYEQQRLLYVATTRAKKRLYLTDFQHAIHANTFKELLREEYFTTIDAEESSLQNLPKSVQVEHLPLAFYAPISRQLSTNPHMTFDIEDPEARFLGIATHVLLQWICTYHPKDLNEVPWQLAINHLQQQGISIEQTKPFLQQIKAYLYPLFHTPQGRWISKKHQQEENELAVLIKQDGIVHTRIIDRTFIENGSRWIIDFKTGQFDAESMRYKKHQTQVNAYAQHLYAIEPMPIRCGLYYLASETWIEWETEMVSC